MLLVGAGDVALQKWRGLQNTGAKVHVVAPEALPEFDALSGEGLLTFSRRPYRGEDLDGVALVFAATDDRELQQRIFRECRERGILVNVVDVPPLCDFYAGAVVERGDIQIAISTGGAAPALAKFLRQKIEAMLAPEYAQFAAVVKGMRPAMLALPKEKRRSLWGCIVSDAFFADIRRDGPDVAAERIQGWIQKAAEEKTS